MSESLVFDDTTQAIPLADAEPEDGSEVTVTGWGLLGVSFTLKFFNLKVTVT